MPSFAVAGLAERDTPKLKKARDRYRLGIAANTKQVQRETDDIAFSDGQQWPADLLASRKGEQPANGLPAVPDRPTLVVDKTKAPIRQVLNSERNSDIGIELVPADDFGDLGITPDDTEVKFREGLIRRIQRDSEAADARTWAFKRAVIAGRGYYMVMTRYLPGPTWDQEVYIHRVFHQESVVLDPAQTAPDGGSDADWGFVGSWMPWDKFQATYPTDAEGNGNYLADLAGSDFQSLVDEYPDWYQSNTDNAEANMVRITDYWYRERVTRTLCLLADGAVAFEDELPEGADVVDTRSCVEDQVKFCKIAGGVMILEETDWPSPYIPLIKVIGEEVLPYDGERRCEGMIRPSRDAQQAENYMLSRFVETVGLSPLSPVIIDPDAIDGYEEWWKNSSTRALPFLPARTYDDQGRALKEPHRPQADPHVLPLAQGIAIFDGFIKDTTAVPSPTLGNVDPSLKSGKAIREVVANAQLSTSNFLDNLMRSMRYEAQVINSLLYPIYGTRPGRMVRIMTGEGSQEMHVVTDPQKQANQQAMAQKAAKVAKLTKDAKFNVIVKLSKSSENRRQQFVEMFSNFLSADPAQMAVAGDLFYKNLDIPEARELSERMRVMLAPPVQQLLAAKDEGQTFDPRAAAELEAAKAQMQQMEAMLQELSQKADDNETKITVQRLQAERDQQLEAVRADADLQKTRMDNATRIYVAEIAARTKGLQMDHEAEHEAVAMAHEAAMAEQQAETESAEGLRVVTPDGMVHEFPTPEQAEAFKQAAGLVNG